MIICRSIFEVNPTVSDLLMSGWKEGEDNGMNM